MRAISKPSKGKGKSSIVIKWVISISIIISIFNLILCNSFISKFDNGGGTRGSSISNLPKSRRKPSNALRAHNQNSSKEANVSTDKSDKRRVIEILESSGIIADEMLFQRLPTWHQVKSLYYPNKTDHPIIHGTETCHHFQQTVSPKDRFIAPSGLFNSGTNLLHSLLTQYCSIPGHDNKNITTTQAASDSSNIQEGFQSGILDKPPWNKHVPHEIRMSQMSKMPIIDGIEQSHVLPIYITKDPWYWMQSMCRHPYDANGFKIPSDPCPTLIQNQNYLKGNQTPRKINVIFPDGKRFKNIVFASLIDLWIKWHEEYYQDGTIPQLFIRYEDLLFFPEQVLTTVCECGGGKIINDENGISLMEESVKLGVHPPPYTGLREAISIYRSAVEKDDENDPRLQGLHDDEIHFVKSKLQKSPLMQLFGYVSPK
jgi:hypothetical protein